MSSLVFLVFCQHMLKKKMFPRWHVFGQHTLSILCVLAGMGSLVNTCIVAFCILAGIGGFWSIQVMMHIVSSMSWEGLGLHKLRYILCPRLHGIGLVITS